MIKTIQEFLPLVEQPSRYLGTEINSIKKDHAKVKLLIALGFPDLYEIGTSHFGLQILYYILNKNEQIAAERVFTPAKDMQNYLKSADIPLMSLESKKPLKEFNIIGFSLLYELNYTNVLRMLELADIPLFSKERDKSFPVIIGGGPCTVNPEPIADFFDALVIGDGERVIIEMSEAWLKWKDDGAQKRELWERWSDIKGVYIPQFFEPVYRSSKFKGFAKKHSKNQIITKAIVSDLDSALFPDSPIIPYAKPVHDRVRLEVARGCTRGCRFCQAGMIYRPVRERSVNTLVNLSDAAIGATGYEDVSLLSLSTGDYNCIAQLMEELMRQYEKKHVAVSLPSLRAGTLTPNLMNLIKKVRKTGFTIAPEAGTDRLRKVINKNITPEDIINTVKYALKAGWNLIKLYFMIGLPTETYEDLRGIVDMVKLLRNIRDSRGRMIRINASVATFIPKPHTPFQWAAQVSPEESKEKINWLRDRLNMPGVRCKWQNPEVSRLEGLLARGDRQISRLLVAAKNKGCQFDSWTDEFKNELWDQAISEENVDTEYYIHRNRPLEESLPWEHISVGVSREFLKKEWEKALAGEQTPDCRVDECAGCGVCDFENISPKIFEPHVIERKEDSYKGHDDFFKTFEVLYLKYDNARFFGHLELVNIFSRAFARAKIPVSYSKGFHPKQKISFEDPLPVGIQGLNEILYVAVSENIKPEDITHGLNRELPDGIMIKGCRPAPAKAFRHIPKPLHYTVELKDGCFDEKELKRFLEKPEHILKQVNKKGKQKTIDLKKAVLKIEHIDSKHLSMILKPAADKKVRPSKVIDEIFSLSKEQIQLALVVKKGVGSS
jgi:radical SAM family uncharacterized protein/radical SAM-linked protein